MKPTDQTRLGYPDGNCWEACIASILEIPIDSVPQFRGKNGEWFEKYRDWIAQFGLDIVPIDPKNSNGWFPSGYYIISGSSPRGNWDHSVIGYEGKMIFDPHPDRTGIDESNWVEYSIFTLVEPSKIARLLELQKLREV